MLCNLLVMCNTYEPFCDDILYLSEMMQLIMQTNGPQVGQFVRYARGENDSLSILSNGGPLASVCLFFALI